MNVFSVFASMALAASAASATDYDDPPAATVSREDMWASVNSTTGVEDSSTGERRRQAAQIAYTALMIKNAASVINNLKKSHQRGQSNNNCQFMRDFFGPQLEDMKKIMLLPDNLVLGGRNIEVQPFTIYAGFHVEGGIIGKKEHMRGMFLDSRGASGCFTTECTTWGLTAEIDYGFGIGFLEWDHTELAGDSHIKPSGFPDVGFAFTIGRSDGTTSSGVDFVEATWGVGGGLSLMDFTGFCHTKVEDVKKPGGWSPAPPRYHGQVCFDIEREGTDWCGVDGEGPVNEAFQDAFDTHTNCKVCISQWTDAGPVPCTRTCQKGVYNFGDCEDKMDCIRMPKGFSLDQDFMIEIECDDALWIDRIRATDGHGKQRWYGADNDQGWCMSTYKWDHKEAKGAGKWMFRNWKLDVPEGKCYESMKFTPSGGTHGYHVPTTGPCIGKTGQNWAWNDLNDGVVHIKFFEDIEKTRIRANMREGRHIELESDLFLRVQRDDSEHGSWIKYIRKDTGVEETFHFTGGSADHTRFETRNGGRTATCHGSPGDRDECEELYPKEIPVDVIITEVYLNPRKGSAHADQWRRNKFTLTGTGYQICFDGTQSVFDGYSKSSHTCPHADQGLASYYFDPAGVGTGRCEAGFKHLIRTEEECKRAVISLGHAVKTVDTVNAWGKVCGCAYKPETGHVQFNEYAHPKFCYETAQHTGAQDRDSKANGLVAVCHGNHERLANKSPAECMRTCDADVKCKGFSYETSERSCFMFRGKTCDDVLNGFAKMHHGRTTCTEEWCNYDKKVWAMIPDHHCGGTGYGPLDDDTPYRWVPPENDITECKKKCEENADCVAFVWKESTNQCHWKENVDAVTPYPMAGHDCYRMRGCYWYNNQHWAGESCDGREDTPCGCAACTACPQSRRRTALKRLAAATDFQ